ncbi:MAG TPA: molybdopterin-dependent oxidoreductase [Gemmatimonadaceae bacterium]|jgi:anaerobic selenocysteine-containing dehydrogenase/Fe-S-cluster-containing dehydrogenase component|nr:molybdopterin-dependent oxidoreductase [Gemmatimonadaceae bacterium]
MTVKRREFLKVVGAGVAAGTVTACGKDHYNYIIPYLNSPDETVPGVSTYYASTCRECAASCGVIVETRDGRALKVEGNPNHPLNRGALCARGQSALQGLYNPDRYKGPMMRQGDALVPATWEQVQQKLTQALTQTGNKASQAVFINGHETGSFAGFLDQWLAAFGMPPHLSYDGEAPAATIAANRQSYGVAWPSIDFAAAQLIVSFGADFLDGWGATVPQQLDFADARAKVATAPRFVYIGARRSLTGLNADEWIPAKPGSEHHIANALLGKMSIEAAATAAGVPVGMLQRLAAAVKAAKPSLFLAGGTGPDALELALAANALNQAAGNVGQTIKPAAPLNIFEHTGTLADIRDVVDRMKAGTVPILFVRGANPAYATPASLGFAAAMAKVPLKVSFSSYPDETAELCDIVLPDHHALESWGDAEPIKGTLSLQQPTMDPVFNTKATADVLIAIAKAVPAVAPKFAAADYRSWLMGRFPGGVAAFTNALPTAIATGASALAPAPRPAIPAKAGGAETSEGDFYVVVYPSVALGDGAGANKPWLQELPDPVTKIAWQSVIELHPETARTLGIQDGDHLQLKTATGTVTAPAYVYLGIRPDTIGVALGRGHTKYGRYAANVGINALDLLPAGEDKAGALVLSGTKATLTKLVDHSLLVSTEGSARQHGRGVAQAIAVGELGKPPEKEEAMPGDAPHEFLPGLRAPVANDAQGAYGDPKSNDKGLYNPENYAGMTKRRWAMTVDLARCTGCSACVTACYAENNIPTVGADWQIGTIMPDRKGFGANITRGREMAWIRLERYYEGAEEPDGTFDPSFDVRFLPMMCQQCGNAPCEPVCPVYATYHAPDGLNVQVYNRCVGTRYCSNNCPYKVRYFNWFGYGETNRPQYAFPEPLNWQLNPDVTVRGKGVMEKCTFCVQRIREAENRARLEGREVQPDEFTTACAQGCPSRALTFGDAADPRWSVAKSIEDARAYHVFNELNTFTAVVYLKKVTYPATAET